jgi:GNAT superfamily N-acetyltransferase
MVRIKVRRTHREELPGLGLIREAAAGEASLTGRRLTLDLELEVDPDLDHLARHDPDAFLTAIEGNDTVGFIAAHVRGRQWTLSEIAVLPQYRGRGAGELLLSRSMEYASRAGVREFLALANESPAVLALLLRQDFAPVVPVYRMHVTATHAAEIGSALGRLLPGQEVTSELLNQRGQGDVDRIDRIARGATRQQDHIYWIKQHGCNVAFVRQGARVAGYGCGRPGRVGPVAGSTQDAALCALGWALQLASTGHAGIELSVPATFRPAVEALLDGGARVDGARLLMGRGVNASFDRYVLAPGDLL